MYFWDILKIRSKTNSYCRRIYIWYWYGFGVDFGIITADRNMNNVQFYPQIKPDRGMSGK